MTQRFAGQPILPRWVEKSCNRVGLRMPDQLNLVDQLGLVHMPDHLDQLVRLSLAFLSEPACMLDQHDLKLTSN